MKYTVGIKIAMMNAIAVVSLIFIAFANYYSTDKLVQNTNWRQHTYIVKENLAKLQTSLIDAETGERGYLVTRQSHYLEPYQLALTEIPENLSTLKSLTGDNAAQQKRLDDLSIQIKNVLALIQQSVKSTDSKQVTELMESGKRNMDDIRKTIKEMDAAEDSLLAVRIENAKSSITFAFYTIIIGTTFAITILALLGVYLTRNISKPLSEITHAANQIALGNLNVSIPATADRTDEVAALSSSFAKMSGALQGYANVAKQISSGNLAVNIEPLSEKDTLGNSLKEMINSLYQYSKEVSNAVNILASSVTEISTSTRQLASSANEQATAVGETTSTIEEVKQTANVTSAKAKLVSDTAQAAVEISKSGKKFTQETNDGMMRIRDQMKMIGESMMRLSEQAQSISSIVSTVDDLAQQSNLLAVNASIEAEKAGDQGRGFRIVAQEIKNLADQSKQATGRIREILSEVQKATNTAVLSTEHGNKVVESGVKKSEETGDAIAKLSASVLEATQAAMQITASSSQQLVGVEQVSTAMGNIKTSAQLNLESSRQLETAATNLKELGSKLQELVGKYRTA